MIAFVRMLGSTNTVTGMKKCREKTFFVALMNSPTFPWSTGGRFLVTSSKNPAFGFAMSATFDIPHIRHVVKSHLRVIVFRLWQQFDDLVEQVVPSPSRDSSLAVFEIRHEYSVYFVNCPVLQRHRPVPNNYAPYVQLFRNYCKFRRIVHQMNLGHHGLSLEML